MRGNTHERYKNEIDTGNRITFQEGKGHRLVPVLIPDVVPAMEFLSSELVSRDCTIKQKNQYCFPSIGRSEKHVLGWHALDILQKVAGDNVNRIMNRHKVSLLIGASLTGVRTMPCI